MVDVAELHDWVAEIRGIDCRRPLDPDDLATLATASARYPLLVVRDQDLTPAQQAAFSRQFGPLEAQVNRKYVHPDSEDVLVLSNELRPDGTAVGVVDAGDQWHSDSSHFAAPARTTILHARQVPTTGGDTEFCNMYLVFEALPAALQQRLPGLYGVHHVSKLKNPRATVSERRPGAADDYLQTARERSEVLQPVVRVHPDTGRWALFVSPRFTIGIDGVTDDEAQQLLDDVFAVMDDPRWQYRYRWSQGDLVMWDNRCLTHRACGGVNPPDIRTMHRTVVAGEPPVSALPVTSGR